MASSFVLLLSLIFIWALIQAEGCCQSCSRHPCCTTCYSQCNTCNCEQICQRQRCSCDNVTTTTTNGTIFILNPTRAPQTNTSWNQAGGGGQNNITNNVAINNQLTNVNNITVPINISVSSSNYINIKGGHDWGWKPKPEPKPEPNPEPQPQPEPEPQTIRPPIRYPVFVPVKVPIPVPIRCCVIIQPCVSLGCQPYRYTCGGSCKSSYIPTNPCITGCNRSQYWRGQDCNYGNCRYDSVDCSACSYDFYRTYEGWSQCHGCFYR